MRKLLRSIARFRMKQEGIQKMNKRPWIMQPNGMMVQADSYFSENWRKYV